MWTEASPIDLLSPGQWALRSLGFPIRGFSLVHCEHGKAAMVSARTLVHPDLQYFGLRTNFASAASPGKQRTAERRYGIDAIRDCIFLRRDGIFDWLSPCSLAVPQTGENGILNAMGGCCNGPVPHPVPTGDGLAVPHPPSEIISSGRLSLSRPSPAQNSV